MKTSAQGVAFIAAHEGVVTRAYRDVAGVWTIGVGHTAAAGPPAPVAGMTISRERAMQILAEDLPKYERRTARVLPQASQSAFDGAVSFDFNTGAIDRASWVPAFAAGRTGEARARLMQWTKAGGRVVGGLVRRRAAEADLIFSGRYGEAGAATPESAPSAAAGEEAQAYLGKLAKLGFSGADAVRAYQKSHPDLVADGILGPATRAQIDRDIAARTAIGTIGGGIAIGAGGSAAGGLPWWVVVLLAAVAVSVAAVAAWRYRDELRRILKPKGQTP